MDRQQDVGGVVRLVRPLLHSFGLRLPNQVRVELVAPADLPDVPGEQVHGWTVVDRAWDATPAVHSIKVVSGMPATRFGQVVAHEMAHGWLSLCPGTRTRALEEGICDLVGSWWLHHRGGRLARHYLHQLMQNPDPLYGDGYRSAFSRAGHATPSEVVRRVEETGRL